MDVKLGKLAAEREWKFLLACFDRFIVCSWDQTISDLREAGLITNSVNDRGESGWILTPKGKEFVTTNRACAPTESVLSQ